jgi:hypothetical protein
MGIHNSSAKNVAKAVPVAKPSKFKGFMHLSTKRADRIHGNFHSPFPSRAEKFAAYNFHAGPKACGEGSQVLYLGETNMIYTF